MLDAFGIAPGAYPIGPKLLSSLEKLGILLLYFPFYTEAKAVGLSWWQNGRLPVIVVAARVSARRGYFTVAHEVMHLVKHLPLQGTNEGFKCTSVHTVKDGDRKEEREANHFASELLMPNTLRAQAEAMLQKRSLGGTVRELSQEWDVSNQAVALRLVSWELANQSQIGIFFQTKPGFSPTESRPHEERFGSREATRRTLERLHESGSSARYIAWATKMPLDVVLHQIGRLHPEEVSG